MNSAGLRMHVFKSVLSYELLSFAWGSLGGVWGHFLGSSWNHLAWASPDLLPIHVWICHDLSTQTAFAGLAFPGLL